MTDRPDDSISSEELIRRARLGLGEEDDRSPAPMITDEPATPTGFEAPAEPAPPPFMTDEPPSLEAEMVDTRAPMEFGEPAPPVDDGSGSLLPDHFQPGRPVQRRTGFFTKIGAKLGWIAAAIVAVIVVVSLLDPSTSVDNLAAGDCLQDPGLGEFETVDTVDCAEPHDYEVFAVIGLRGDAGRFPGDDDLYAEAWDACQDTFVEYTGLRADDPSHPYFFHAFYPTEEAWNANSRDAVCALFRFNAAGTDFLPMTGSIRDRT